MLFAGAEYSGRRVTMRHLAGLSRDRSVEGYSDDHRTAEVHAGSERVLLCARVPYFGSHWYQNYREILDAEHEWLRVAARGLLDFLPTIDGVVFVADACRLGRSIRALRLLLEELPRAGVDPQKIPVVIQCNKVDRPDAVRVEEMIAHLSTPRCAYAESVAAAGFGVQRAFEMLVRMIDDAGARFATPTPLPPRREAPPAMLFEEISGPLTGDGEIHAALRTSTREAGLALGRSAVALGWPKRVLASVDFVAGRYSIDVTTRMLAGREGSRFRSIEPRIIAGRIHLPGASVTSREPLDEGITSTYFVLVAAPEVIATIEHERIAQAAYACAEERGAVLLSPHGATVASAEAAELALLQIGTWNEVHVWLGRDQEGRVVELSCWGDVGAGALARGSP